MKKSISVILVLCLIFLCGFTKREKPYILLSSGNNTVFADKIRSEHYFQLGQKIYYNLIIPSGVKYEGVRMQLSKQDDKTSNWGFSIILTKDLYLSKTETALKDYLLINQKGHYILQFFYLNNKRYPFAHTEFMVN